MRTTQRRGSRFAVRPAKKPQNSWKWKALTAVATLSLLTQTTAFGLLITPANTAEAINQIAVPAQGQLVITKDIVKQNPEVPGTLVYTIHFLNDTGFPITNITIEDPLVDALSYVVGSATYSIDGIPHGLLKPDSEKPLRWSTIVNVLPDDSYGDIVFTVNLSKAGVDYPGYPNDCSVGNTASISANALTTDSHPVVYSATTNKPVVFPQLCNEIYAPDLQVDKKIANGGELPGSITYVIHYSNQGNWPAYNVSIADQLALPFAPSQISTTPAYTNYDPATGIITWIDPSVVNQAPEKEILVTITPAPENFLDGQGCRQLTNDATIAQNLPTPTLSAVTHPYPEVNLKDNASSAAPTTLFYGTCNPTLTLTKTDGIETTTKGSTLTYTVAWTVADDDAPTLMVTDTLPAGLTFVSASGTGVYDPATRTVTWTYTPGVSGSETVTATVDATASGTITNPAAIQVYQNGSPVGAGKQASDDTAVAQDTVVVPPQQTTLLAPVIMVDKTANKATAVANDLITYSVTIKNTGTAAAENLTLTDTLPSGFVYNDFLASERTWTVSPLFAPGSTTTITYGVRVSSGVSTGDYTNTATARATGLVPVTDRATVHVDAPQVLGATTGTPKLVLEKTADRETANPGDTVDFTVTVTNTGDGPATEVSISDFLPDGLTFDDGTTSKAWTVGTLEAKDSKSFTYTTTVSDDALEGTYTNVADVSYAEGDPIEALAPVDIQPVRVLGASTLAETGADMNDYLLFGSGAVLLFLAALGFRKASLLA